MDGNSCKGCLECGTCDIHPQTYDESKLFKCPCIKCLMKVVCDDPCQEWRDYTEHYFAYPHIK